MSAKIYIHLIDANRQELRGYHPSERIPGLVAWFLSNSNESQKATPSPENQKPARREMVEAPQTENPR